jgi:hypothetical protein
MKRKITLLLLAASTALTMNSQVLINEGFTNPFNPATAGWVIQNNSAPLGTTTWTQGTTNYAAYDGGATDYYFANFNSAGATAPAGISNWFITPAVTIYNGAVIQFATKTINQGTGQPNFAPDRLQLRMSQTGVTAIPAGTASIGSFTDLLLDINPNLNTSTVSAVNGGSVNGYPNAWTVYSVQISGVTGTVTGRFAFRYFVNDGGAGGANSNNIGLDRVKYTLPCGPSVFSYTSCAGTPVVLNSTGGLPATTYSWSNGGTTFSTTVTPTITTPGATQVYTLYPSNGNISCGTSQTATVTIGAQLTMSVAASATTICSGNVVVLTANGPSSASTYTWLTGTTVVGSGAAITVTPGTTTTYSVGSLNGTCYGGNGITINVNASPSLTYAINPSPICLGATNMTISTTGAVTYTYVLASSNVTTNPLTSIAVPTVTGVYQLGIYGTGANGCVAGGTGTFAVNPNPTIQVTSSKAIECINRTVTLTATGADTYSWSGATTGTTSPITYSTGTTAGNKTFTVVGTTSLGCSGTAVRTISVSICSGIENQFGNLVETSVFPNPFTNEIKIGGLNGSVDIYNALGQVILSTKVNDTETINTADLTKGVYILKAYSNEGQELKTIKLLKN